MNDSTDPLATWIAAHPMAETAKMDSTIQPLALSETVVSRPGGPNVSDVRLPALDLGEAGEDRELQHLERIGQGGMGLVDLVHQRSLGRDVVLKQPRPDLDDPRVGPALLLEGRLTGRLEHPNIIPVHALGHTPGGQPALLMKRISGTNWRELLIDPGHATWDDLPDDRLRWHVETLIQVCHAVEYAHDNYVVHRDIKPENVMIGAFGEVYLLDWGIGLELEDGECFVDTMAGTPAYMAPEMVVGSDMPITAQTDVYLLGATLHEILVGEPPHSGSSVYVVLRRAAISAPADYPDDVPTELARICHRAMAADPTQRYPAVRDLRRALLDYLEHRVGSHLLQTAQHKLHDLQAAIDSDADGVSVHRLAIEGRFALQQADDHWPDAPTAAARRRLSLTMARYELDRGNLEGATRHLAELEEVPEALAAKVAALRREAEAAQRAQAELAALQRDQDTRVGLRARSTMLIAVSTCSAVAIVATALLGPVFGFSFRTLSLLLPVGLGLGGLPIVYVFRREILNNRVNRQLVALYFFSVVAIETHRLIGAWQDVPLNHMFTADMVLMAFAYGGLGIFVERWIVAIAAAHLPAVVLAVLFPEWSIAIISVMSTLGFVAIVAGWLLLPRSTSGSDQRAAAEVDNPYE